jgi:hypothetical protein
VYLHRPAVGEWVCLDASTTIGIPGVGLAQSRLWDAQGPIGRAAEPPRRATRLNVDALRPISGVHPHMMPVTKIRPV